MMMNALNEDDQFKVDEKHVSHAFYLTEPPVQLFTTGDQHNAEGFGPFSANAIKSPL
jgi:hypothetical protein